MFAPFEIDDRSGLGFLFGEFDEGAGLFFEGVGGGGDENENDAGHYDQDEASGEGRACCLLFGLGVFFVGHGGTMYGVRRQLNSEL